MRTVADVLNAAVPALGDVKQFLLRQRESLLAAKAQAPDLSPFFDARIAELDAKVAILESVVDQTRLAELAVTVVRELAALPQTGLRPVPRPGDVTGG